MNSMRQVSEWVGFLPPASCWKQLPCWLTPKGPYLQCSGPKEREKGSQPHVPWIHGNPKKTSNQSVSFKNRGQNHSTASTPHRDTTFDHPSQLFRRSPFTASASHRGPHMKLFELKLQGPQPEAVALQKAPDCSFPGLPSSCVLSFSIMPTDIIYTMHASRT